MPMVGTMGESKLSWLHACAPPRYPLPPSLEHPPAVAEMHPVRTDASQGGNQNKHQFKGHDQEMSLVWDKMATVIKGRVVGFTLLLG